MLNPPQIPNFGAVTNANSRHASRTGHAAHTTFADAAV
jgi:hypothetical protein